MPPALFVFALVFGMTVTVRFVPVPSTLMLLVEDGTRAGLDDATAKVKVDALANDSSAIVNGTTAGTSSGLVTSVSQLENCMLAKPGWQI